MLTNFKIELYPFTKIFILKTCIENVTVWLEFRHIKLRTKNSILFHEEAKYVRKQTRADKNGYRANPPFKITHFKTSHFRMLLRLRRNYFWGLAETLATQVS